MKKFILTLMGVISFLSLSVINTSCDKLSCDGLGTLSVENKSLNTVQRLMINGVNYGSIDPGKTKEVELTPGTYAWQLVGLSGGSGCSPAVANIAKCETSSFSCSN